MWPRLPLRRSGLSLFRGTSPGRTPAERSRRRLRLEALEERCLLASAGPFRFDFGPTNQVVAPGYVALSTNTYLPKVGYGWDRDTNLSTTSRSWTNADPLVRDFVSGTDRMFKVDLANGVYSVTPTLGDRQTPRDRMNIYIQGIRMGVNLSTAAGQWISPTYQATVTDGRLAIQMTQGVGSSSTWALDALVIQPVVASTAPLTVSAGANQTINQMSTTTLTGSMTGGMAPYSYNWNFGDGTTPGTALSTTHVYTTPGTYTATLKVTDAIGASASSSLVATVKNVAPTVNIGGPYQGKAQSAVVFAATASDVNPAENASLVYSWNFGDGTTGTGASPSHTFANDGSYNVSLSVADPYGGSTPASTVVTIYPSVSVIAVPPVNAGAAISFQGAAVGSTSFAYGWTFGDGGTASGTLRPTYTFANPGSYTTTLTATDSGNRSGSASITVTVNDVAPTVSVSVPASGATGAAVSFTASAASISPAVQAAGFTYSWNFGDGGTATGASPSHAFATAGSYVVTVTGTDMYGKSGTSSGTIAISGTSTLAVSAGSNKSTNAGSSVSFVGTVSGGTAPYTYSWNFGDGTSGGANTAQIDSTTQGSWKGVFGADGYQVIGDASNYPSYAVVTPSGQATYTWVSSTTDVRALQKSASGSTSRIAASWYSNTSFVIDVNLTDGKVHALSLYALDWDSTDRSERIDVLNATSGVVLSSQTISDFSGGKYLTWNVSGHVQFKVTSLEGTNAVISGLFIGAAANAGAATLTPSHTYYDPGTYTATLTAKDSAGRTGSSSLAVTVNDVAPVVSLSVPPAGTVGKAVSLAATATSISPAVQAAGFSYNWVFGDGTTGTGASTSHIYSTVGSYTLSVTATDTYGKTSMLATATILIASVTIPAGSTINIDAAWLQQRGVGPYSLDQANTTYLLQTDVTTSGSAFVVRADGITLDLNGHKVTYDNSQPIVVPNGGLESGNLSNWNVAAAPSAKVVPQSMMWGKWMGELANIKSTETLISGQISIPQANVQYLASLTCHGPYGANVTLSVIDAVTKAVLSTSSTDPGHGGGLLAGFIPTTTNPVQLKLDFSPGSNASAWIDFDYVQVVRTNMYGVDLSYRQGTITSRVAGGTIAQGTGRSAGSYPINGYGSNLTVTNITVAASGLDTTLVYGNWSTGTTIKDCTLVASLDQITNRMASLGFIYLVNSSGVIDVENNRLTGSHQNGIVISGSSGASPTSVVIKGNNISHNSTWTNGYAIGMGTWVQNFEIANNTIIPVSGRGIMVDSGGSSASAFIKNGSIHDNYVEVQEHPDLEYGQTGLEVPALRVRSEDGFIRDLSVYNNTFYAHTDVGLDWACAGARFTIYNKQGQNNNTNLVFQNNLFKAIVVKRDPNLTDDRNLAWGLTFSEVDAGVGMKFIGNQFESNSISLNFGDNDGSNEAGITFISNTIVKSTSGVQTIPYTSILAGSWGSEVHNILLIDMRYQGGATPGVTFDYVLPKDISIGWLLNLTVTNADGTPAAGATVSLFDKNNQKVFTGTTDSKGKLTGIAVVTTTYTQAGTNPAQITTTTSGPFVVQATSGTKTKSQSFSLTGNLDLTLALP